ncbi:hypothetical protein [Parapedobacter indicus]|uniref:Uncharacterized protein n=1 Tax=Parapedobacter indicus TaxID=1477437 RepID=A0A1I3SY86_9SPHI|nr:hypothetical protein [Parapedobacter indicus]PPK99680.1 hypothetical protein CLV26_11110 [Parapedobacter indicus]SFJ62386.1 hypothetical protein SAMN05444682_111189 [Parapedobacter indicus]
MNSFKRLCIVFSAFSLSYFGEIAINIACGPEPDPYDYYVSFFHNNVPGNGYVPFSFTNMTFLYEETEPESEALINSREWADYLGKGVQAVDVEHLMYHTDIATDSVILRYLTGKDTVLPDSLAANTYLKGLKRNEAAGNYFLFAKELEPYAAVTYNHYWDPDPRDTMDLSRMAGLADRALELADEYPRNSFLRLRYAYQAARMYHYSGSFERCLETYNGYIDPSREKSAVKGWARALKAGATRRLHEPAEAAYLFSRVFATSPERRVQAYKNFHYIDVPFEEVLALAQSNKERAAIWAIQGFNNGDFDRETLASVYSLSPKSQLVAVLLTREINKLESQLTEASQYYGGGWWTTYYRPDSTQAKARDHAVWVADFARRLASERQYAEPGLGIVSEAYVEWLLGNVSEAETLLAGIKVDRLSERLADQYRIVELLIKINQLAVTNTVDEAAILPALQWLDQKRRAEIDQAKARYGSEQYSWMGAGDLRFNRTATNLYQSVLAPHYMQQKDTAMAALLMWKGESPWETETEQTGELYGRLGWPTQAFWQEQLQPATLEQLATWSKEGLNRPWAPLFAQQLGGLESDQFWDLLGTAYLRMHDYPAAARAFANLSAGFALPTPVNWYSAEEDTLWPDPFVATLNDYPKQFGDEALTKAEFARSMADLQRRIVEDPGHAADYYFQLANGVYQTGAFGNSWQLISYSWTSSDNYVKGTYYYSGDFHEARQAAVWYKKARELSKDREFRAKCTFMLAKCEQKSYLFNSVSDYYNARTWERDQPDPYWLFSQRNQYFKELKEDYLDTKFIGSAVAECTYLADFIRPNSP